MAAHCSSRCSLRRPNVDSRATVTQSLRSHRRLPYSSIALPWCTRRRRAAPVRAPADRVTLLSTTAY
ncbi:hypothetical protein E2542_SST14302 [Spatholobus suberectus]|nr:hypothetical protein E2542_SST14302 [Spatholobus suberectus]